MRHRPTRRPGAPLNPRTVRAVALTSAANLAILGSLTAPAIALIPLRVSAFAGADDRAGVLAAVLAIGAVAAVLANPLFGALSDRTRTRWGPRAPWIIGGAAAGTAGVLAMSVADGIASLTIAWVLTQAGYNAAAAAVAAQFADALSESERSAASGVFAASTFLGTLPSLALVALLPARSSEISVGVALVSLVPLLACAVLLRGERREAREPRTPVDSGRPGVRAVPAFAALWMQRLLMLLAFGLTTEFSLYLVIDRMGATPERAASVSALATLIGGAALVLASAVAGFIAGRRGDYRPFLVFSVLALTVAAGLRAVTDAVPLLWLGAAVGGFAMGVFFAVNLALALRIIPPGRAGQYLGLLNITETIPQVVVPLLAATLLAVGGADPLSGAPGNYAVLYGSAAAVALLAGATLWPLRKVARRPDAS